MSWRIDAAGLRGVMGSLAAGGGSLARFLLRDSAPSRAAADAPMPRTPPQHTSRRNAPWVMRSASWPGRWSRAMCASRRAKGQLTGPERRALSGSAPPASRALPPVASPGRWAQAPTLDPGATADPAGLTARARPKARPDSRAATPQDEQRISQVTRCPGRMRSAPAAIVRYRCCPW